jgi:DNA-binding transcriptional MerR regulator
MLTIGKVAALAHVSTDTLRYYERERLLTPARKSDAGYRLYDGDSVRRIRFIKQAQHCGFTLVEIAQLLALRHQPAARCGDVRRIAIEKKRELQARIRTMKTMSKALDRLLADCSSASRPPVLVILLSALGLTAFVAKLDYVLVPVFVASIALVIFALMRRRRSCAARTPQAN